MHRSFLVFAAAFCLMAAVSLTQAHAQAAPDAAAEVDKRIQRLEEQIVDLSAQLGTVESMAHGGGGGAAPAAAPFGGGGDVGGGADGGRLADIETQVRALSAQMNEIVRRLGQLERRSGGLAPSREPDAGGRDYGSVQRGNDDPRLGARPAEQGTGFSVGGNEPPVTGFDAAIEPSAARRPPQGGQPDYSAGVQAAPPAGERTAAVGPIATASRSSAQAQAAYEKAYGALVQRNYRAASDAFEQFVKAYPSDPLAGPAYFWLGEASFTSGEYRQAAESFLKSSTNYPENEKAAESLLKLGISLKRLGENQEACRSFSELARRFPSATPVLQRAEREKSRAQC